MKPGDRYKHITIEVVIEIVKVHRKLVDLKIVEQGHTNRLPGDIVHGHLMSDDRNWLYIGNYEKSEHFKSLYEKLSN